MERIAITSAILAVILSLPLFATSVGQVNLTEMVLIADRIFLGTCLSAREAVDPKTGIQYIRYSFQVIEGIKGVQQGTTLHFNQLLTAGEQKSLPRFEVGEERVLFLHPDSRLGFTSPVGFFQGSFKVSRMESGRTLLRNRIANKNLAAGLTSVERQILENAASYTPELSDERAIDLETLRRFVEKVAEGRRKGGV